MTEKKRFSQQKLLGLVEPDFLFVFNGFFSFLSFVLLLLVLVLLFSVVFLLVVTAVASEPN